MRPFGALARRLRRPIGVRTAVCVTVAVLALTNVASNRWASPFAPLTATAVSALLLGVLWWAGCTWAEAGLAPASWRRGARWAGVLVGMVAVVYLSGALLPMTRELFEDERYDRLTEAQLAWRVLVTVPFGTVLLEEVAFRGVLYGLLLRARGVTCATVLSSALFGLWHVLPSPRLTTAKPALTPVFGDSPLSAALGVMAAVLFTGAAGVLLCELRRRSGSLLAPMGLHWAVNALGYVVGFLLR